jgi:hypothetical protein
MGIGVEVGTALASRVNVRGGFNAFSYSRSLSKDGTNYDGTLKLRSVDAKVDLFVLGGFHITPGALLHDGNSVSATTAQCSPFAGPRPEQQRGPPCRGGFDPEPTNGNGHRNGASGRLAAIIGR